MKEGAFLFRKSMIAALFIIPFFFFIPARAEAATTIPVANSIASPTTWTLSGSPYFVQGLGQLSVTGVLTIEPCVVVKFDSIRSNGRWSGLWVRSGGSLVAHGTEDQPIIFTSIHDDVGGDTNNNGVVSVPTRGDWYGIKLDGDASDISHAEVRYAGNSFFAGFSILGGVEIRGGSRARVTDTVISDNRANGLAVIEPAEPTLERLTIEENGGFGAYTTLSSGSVIVRDSVVRNNEDGAIRMRPDNALLFEDTEFIGNTPQIVDINNGTDTIFHDTRWQYLEGLTYVDDGNGRLFVADGTTLTIDPGVNIKMYPTRGLYVEGELVAEGTEERPIVFTSYRDDSVGGDTNLDGDPSFGSGSPLAAAGGDWGGIYLDHASSSLSYVTFRYGGTFLDDWGGLLYDFDVPHLIHAEASAVSMREVTLEHASHTAVFVDRDSSLDFDRSRIHAAERGIDITADVPLEMHNNSFTSTTISALHNRGTAEIDARRNWWGDDSGPSPAGRGGTVLGNVLYDPWIGVRDPVILVPGITGTHLWDGSDLIWPNAGRMLFDIGDDFLDVLSMDEEGKSVNNTVVTGDIVRSIGISQSLSLHFFDLLVDLFQSHGYQEDSDLFVFPYDWRLGVEANSIALRNKIQTVLNQTGADKVDLVTHIMGGLVAKQYMLDDGGGSVDTLVFVGTPHLGAPKAAKILLFGDNLEIPVLSAAGIKKISRNMLSVYQLLPSLAYFRSLGSYLYDYTEPVAARDYEDTADYFSFNNLNTRHVNAAASFHTAALDDFIIPNGVNVFNISGCDRATLGSIIRRNINPYASGEYSTPDVEEYMIGYVSGDGTVPLMSSDALNIPRQNRFFTSATEHGRMPSQEGIRDVILDLVRHPHRSPTLPDSVFGTRDFCSLYGREISVHSPVDIHIYDSAGNHVGPVPDGTIDKNIPGVTYDDLAQNKFVFLPLGSEPYRIELEATATGTFNLRVAEIESGEPIRTSYYNSVPITNDSYARVELSAGSADDADDAVSLLLDYEGDNSYTTVPVSAILDASASSDGVKPETDILSRSPDSDDVAGRWTRGPVYVSFVATDDDAGLLWTEYSRDNGVTWQIYTGEFAVEEEGVTLLYRSIDRAGNLEEAKSAEVKIDLTPPEVEVSFDSQTRSFHFAGIDMSSSSVAVLIATNTAMISDEAGNSTELGFTDVLNTNGMGYFTRTLRITGMRKNDGEWQTPERNQIFVQWDTHHRTGALRWTQAALQVKNGFYIIGKYDVAKNETIIWEKNNDGVREEVSRINGAVLPKLQIQNLTFNYLGYE